MCVTEDRQRGYCLSWRKHKITYMLPEEGCEHTHMYAHMYKNTSVLLTREYFHLILRLLL